MSQSCPLCLSQQISLRGFRPKDYEYGMTFHGELASCEKCELRFMIPSPSYQEVLRFYPMNYMDYNRSQNRMMNKIFYYYYLREARRIWTLIERGGSILDVGCGNGGFLNALGFQGKDKFFGLEMNPVSAARARSSGFLVQSTTLEEAHFSPESFDLIRMNHVIEHFGSPKKALLTAWRALKIGGLLFGETPNVNCLDFKIFGKYWGALHFPRHIWLFTHASLDLLFRQMGFEKVWVHNCLRTVGWTCGIQNWMVEKFQFFPSQGGRFWWYPYLIPLFLPVTFIQSIVSRTGVIKFLYRKTLTQPTSIVC